MQWIKTPTEVFPYLYKAGLLSILASIFAAIFFRKASLALSSIVLSSCAFLLILTASATPLNNNTIKPLALELKTIIKPDDEVIAYFRYYQDLPLYLEKRIAITADWNSEKIAYKDNWTRELWYGMNFKSSLDSPNWLISEKTFWDRWGSEKRVFALTSKNYFREFESKAKNHVYYKIQTKNDIILLSNRPV